jgi:perosamine synthetase
MKHIFTSLAPNLESDDRALARHLLFRPKLWRHGAALLKLEQWFTQFLGVPQAKTFISGRTALYAILKSLQLEKGSEVLLQAYTCVAVPDPVLWAQLKPIYVDCDKTLTMSPADLERKITPRSKVLIIQHTFGQSADLEKLLAIAKRHNLFVVEDCAHALGASVNGKRLGSYGDAAFFSFGRDKVLSSVFGGVAVTRNNEFGRRLAAFHASLEYPRKRWIAQQLMHPFVLLAAKRWYDTLAIGKILLEAAKRLGIISKAVYGAEKIGKAPAFVFHKMPHAMALLAFLQCEKLERFNAHRRELAAWYDGHLWHLEGAAKQERVDGGGIFLRYAVFDKHAQDMIAYARSKKIELGDWYTTAIAPAGVRYDLIGYQKGSCPVAEELSKVTLNLPTHIGITAADASYIIETLKQYHPQWRSRG